LWLIATKVAQAQTFQGPIFIVKYFDTTVTERWPLVPHWIPGHQFLCGLFILHDLGESLKSFLILLGVKCQHPTNMLPSFLRRDTSKAIAANESAETFNSGPVIISYILSWLSMVGHTLCQILHAAFSPTFSGSDLFTPFCGIRIFLSTSVNHRRCSLEDEYFFCMLCQLGDNLNGSSSGA
jgi:hypothetical protein